MQQLSLFLSVSLYAYYALVVALVAGRVGISTLRLLGHRSTAARWADIYYRMTSYLRA